jgi:hypothetical protein
MQPNIDRFLFIGSSRFSADYWPRFCVAVGWKRERTTAYAPDAWAIILLLSLQPVAAFTNSDPENVGFRG